MKNSLLYLLLFNCCYLNAQINRGGVTIPSPNAASLGMYGEVPVSLYTGMPTVSIPLLSLEDKGNQYPVSLSYQAAGFRPDLHPSWVGLGWNLNFGGAITRTVNKYPDEWKDDDDHIFGYYYSNRLKNFNWSSTDSLASFSNVVWESRADKEPDEFNFNFLGFSGTFYLDHNRKWRVQSNRNLTVLFSPSDMAYPFFYNNIAPASLYSNFLSKSFGKFVLIDDQGVKYTFGTNYAIEYSSSITPPEMDYRNWLIATSWYLTDVSLPNSNGGITIAYERGPFQSSFQFFQQTDGLIIPNCGTNEGSKGISGKVISPVYAKTITNKSDGSKIDFHFSKSNEMAYPTSTYFEVFRDKYRTLPPTVPANYFSFFFADASVPYYVNNGLTGSYGVISNQKFIWFKLDSLTIWAKDFSSAPILKPYERIKFNYQEDSTERLMLLSVTKASLSPGETALTETHYFDYNSGQMPGYLSEMGDHWGFSNGYPLPANVGGGFDWIQGDLLLPKEPNYINCVRGVLKQITYPTGGSTAFEYELHDYGKYVLDADRTYSYTMAELRKNAGGLRLKKLVNNDGLGNSTEREYYYVNGYAAGLSKDSLRSSGVLERLPKYLFHIINGSLDYYMSVSTGVVPLTASGSMLHVGYSEVVERYGDGSYKIYKYTNHDNGYSDENPINTTTPTGMDIPPISRGFERGLLLYEAKMTSGNKMLQKTENTYQRIGAGADSNFIRSLNKEYGGYCKQATVIPPTQWVGPVDLLIPGSASAYWDPLSFSPIYTIGTAFGHYTYRFLLQKAKQTYYSTSGSIVLINETDNQYNEAGFLKIEKILNSKEDTIIRNYKYSYEMAGTAVYDTMIKRNMIAYVVESSIYKEALFLESEKIDFDIYAPGLILPKQIRKKIGNGAEFIQTKFNKYGTNGNLYEFEGRDGIKTSYIWSYYGNKPVAKVMEIDYTTVTAGLSSNVGGGPQNGDYLMLQEIDNLRSLFPDKLIVSYLYDYRYGIKLEKDINGKAVYYEYDGLGRMKLARDKDRNVVKKIEYGLKEQPYQNNIFYNEIDEAVFYKNDCSSCYQGATINYRVPAGKYSSTISQADANQKAQDDINTNGQAYANSNATCVPSASCPMTNGPNFDSPNANFSIISGTVYVNLVVHPVSNYYGSLWTTGIWVGTINCTCRPGSTKVLTATESGRTWEVTVYSTGNIYIRLLSGSYPPPGGSLYFQLNSSYTLN